MTHKLDRVKYCVLDDEGKLQRDLSHEGLFRFHKQAVELAKSKARLYPSEVFSVVRRTGVVLADYHTKKPGVIVKEYSS